MAESNVAAVILAAGGSTRFGQPKQLLPWEGHPLVTHVADMAWTAGFEPVLVVVGAAADEVTPLFASRPVCVVHNYRWAEGLSTSLNTAVSSLPPETDAALFVPIDQPLITPRLLQKFIETWRSTGAGIVIPRSPEGQRGTPVLFAKEFFAELATLSGDVGGRILFERHPDRISYLDVPDAKVLEDADTPETYERLVADAAAAGPALPWREIRGLICDMDGVLWRGKSGLPGIEDFFAMIEALHLEHMMVTNNSSRTPAQYVQKLADLGVTIDKDHILNSALATANYIAGRQPGAAVYAMGGPGVREAIETYGLAYSDDDDVAEVDFVVIGWDQQLTWKKLAAATRLILDGAQFVGTNPDLTFPLETALAPGNGAQIAAIETATGVTATVIGKPWPILYRQAMAEMGTTPDTTLVIGDRLDTDILGGIRLGLPTVLVLTGISNEEELAHSPIRPNVVLQGLPDLVRVWQEAVNG